MITQKMKYALKALLALADEAAREQPRALTIEEIAARSGAPKRFLEHILLEVRNAGVIASMRGRSGGYRLAKPPSEVSISDLLRRIDGPIAPLPCLSRSAYQRCDDCRDEATCRIRRTFGEVFWSYLLIIESLTLEDMLRSDTKVEQIFGT
ncbi:Rrf2 family transcriptional regulator [Paracoccus marinus]|uniref:Rrf2 family transcriptional regulator n=1 Tax=Paracoccus marinus TaxID=288426 RepID=UPI001038BFB7|nr:Rrf2 family transcriptional regulator [Paracoccus marinus]GLS79837.1 Rrf2 family transcriptional regulator [Paracoccus marinus]